MATNEPNETVESSLDAVPDASNTDAVNTEVIESGDQPSKPKKKKKAAADAPKGAKKADAVKKNGKKAAGKKTSKKAAAQAEQSKTWRIATYVLAGLAAALIAALVVFIVRDISARNELAKQEDSRTAERIASEYAVNAATLNYQDLTPWIKAQQKGVTPELAQKYGVIGEAMEQILKPLRMETTADLIVAKTTSVSDNIFTVTVVVNVHTKTVQTPAGGETPAVYTITLDRSRDWMITDVGDPTQAIPDALGQVPGASGTPAAPGDPEAPAPAETPAVPVPTELPAAPSLVLPTPGN